MENKLSIEPTLEIKNTKEYENIESIIIDKIKISRNSTLTIINNPNTSQEQKILLLQQQNLSLIDTLYELKDEIKRITNDIDYSEYRIYESTSIFDLELIKHKITFKTWPTPIKDLADIQGINIAAVYSRIKFYKIHYKDIEKFLTIVKHQKMELL